MWFHIRALDSRINRVLQFWLSADSRKELDDILKKKECYTDIKWVREEIPSWEK